MRDTLSRKKVAVIGAGVVGVISALECLKAGHDVTIVDRATPGGEHAPSYGNGAWITSHSVVHSVDPGTWKKVPGFLLDQNGPLAVRWSSLPRTLPWLLRYLASGRSWDRVEAIAVALHSLISGSVHLHYQLSQQAGVPELIERSGLLHCFASRESFQSGVRAWELRRKLGIVWEELDEAELHRREPDISRDLRFGIYVPEGGYCRNPGRYVSSLFAQALREGAKWEAGQAEEFLLEGGQLKAVRVGSREISSDFAVLSAGTGAKKLAETLGDKVPLQAERGYHVRLLQSRLGPRTPMMSASDKVVITMGENGLRIAGQVEIADEQAPANWQRARILRRQLDRVFPELQTQPQPFSEEKVWMGSRPGTPDGLPFIGHASATRQVIHAFGHGHVGLSASARTGKAVAAMIEGTIDEAWLKPFDPRRFSRRT